MTMDNTAHKALFTLPEPRYSTALATVKPLPVQRKITGNKQVDAYLWVLAVI
ncbi:helix-turn-helix domain-containing protein, partial [Xenorhabdus sp. XENO-10]|nr:helix-turn-helix domain-containing protein [Xenorhabdus yunnanensis]